MLELIDELLYLSGRGRAGITRRRHMPVLRSCQWAKGRGTHQPDEAPAVDLVPGRARRPRIELITGHLSISFVLGSFS